MKRVFIIVAVVVFAVAAALPGVAALAQPGGGGFLSDPSVGNFDASASQAEYPKQACDALARFEARTQNEQLKARIRAAEDRLGCP